MNDGSISTDLYQFFAAYFHQDWDLEADDWEGIVDNYVNADPIADPLRALAKEIDHLRNFRPEPDLARFLVHTVGVYYAPDPLTYKDWLGKMADRLRQHAAAIDSGRPSRH
ncbi:contact-dependent growth inhibition system immunity protein [Mycobacterium sp. WMMD1722]|uniref:contact-dependent growth inhibition system immunity protein n=1 Tax=Mycobacterium sp. WMMD1722 TaxID=3404117 RepID=UPI003BF5DA8F